MTKKYIKNIVTKYLEDKGVIVKQLNYPNFCYTLDGKYDIVDGNDKRDTRCESSFTKRYTEIRATIPRGKCFFLYGVTKFVKGPGQTYFLVRGAFI